MKYEIIYEIVEKVLTKHTIEVDLDVKYDPDNIDDMDLVDEFNEAVCKAINKGECYFLDSEEIDYLEDEPETIEIIEVYPENHDNKEGNS